MERGDIWSEMAMGRKQPVLRRCVERTSRQWQNCFEARKNLLLKSRKMASVPKELAGQRRQRFAVSRQCRGHLGGPFPAKPSFLPTHLLLLHSQCFTPSSFCTPIVHSSESINVYMFMFFMFLPFQARWEFPEYDKDSGSQSSQLGGERRLSANWCH